VLTPPDALLEAVEVSPIKISTTADLIASLQRREKELGACTAKLDAIREWKAKSLRDT
jgi:hypothetical protein